jgi:hypothetical protein
MSKQVIRIGGASGFWGDSTIAAPQLLAGGKLDYLVFDYLAEITMSIMARSRAKDPEQGYAHDFVTQVMKQSLPELAKQKVKVVANAGGVNPIACAKAVEALIQEMGLNLKVATVIGDDLIGRVDELRAAGTKEMFTGAPMPAKFMSVNAYLGGFPIAKALAQGADIVITGRVVDSAVTLGPCIHEFGWKESDYDQLAQGSLAGHIIECGAQATGGLFTDWDKTGSWENIGYPIAEVEPDGSFTVSKVDGTGGLVSRQTVAEQLVYEIGDPQAYILPDAVCDFSQVKIEDTGKDRARVSGAKGLPPTDTLKVSATYMDGFRLGAYVSIRGIDAAGKAQKTADAVLKRTSAILKRMGAPDLTETSVEIIGAEAGYGPHARVKNPREVILKLAAKHPAEPALALLLRELTSSGTSMAPGTSGMGGNRAKPSPVVRLFSCTVDRASVVPEIIVGDARMKTPNSAGKKFDAAKLVRPQIQEEKSGGEPTVEVPLVKIAHGRSGDKGNDSNIGIIARKPEFYPILRRELTAEVVRNHFSYLMDGGAERYDLPGLNAVNFLLKESLGGGGIASLRNDPQGKAYAQILLDFPIRVPKQLADAL